MTKQDLTSIVILVDESGSMNSLQQETISGINAFVDDQKKLPGSAELTLAKFSYENSYLFKNKPLTEVTPLTTDHYRPAGGTALLDSLGTAVDDLGAHLKSIPEEARPGKVIFVVITDGQENSSRRFNRSQVAEMTKHQQDKYNWEFVFLGANLDAVHEANTLGFKTANAVNYSASSVGTQSAYRGITKGIGLMRGLESSDDLKSFSFAVSVGADIDPNNAVPLADLKLPKDKLLSGDEEKDKAKLAWFRGLDPKPENPDLTNPPPAQAIKDVKLK